MAKMLKEIGLRKALRFGYLSPLVVLMRACPYPQIRGWLLKLLGAKIGRSAIINNVSFMSFYNHGFSNLKIGDNSFLGVDVMLDLAGKIKIGKNSTVAARSIVLTHTNVGYTDHPLRKKYPKKVEGTKIGSGCFIGVGSIILSGIKVGDNALVGSGSVVTKDVKPSSVVFGNPAIEHKKKK